ncbi:FecR domain-containing protein [Marinicella rhabdoformis]|uniref:FecR domain-containing protein n=1 Tax=Marinicella rhabdoformis TaxID=2580566 RepID=UPI0012AEBBBC|nr:FecR family protein [Marinicella rhabdoformis]
MDNAENKKGGSKGSNHADELLTQLGNRTTPDAQKSAESKAVVKAHWQQQIQKHKKARQAQHKKYLWPMAASFLLVASLLLFRNQTEKTTIEPVFLASIAAYQGEVSIQQIGGKFKELRSDSPLKQGTQLQTDDDSFLSMKLLDNSEIRLAANTTLILRTGSIELKQGQLYHDTDSAFKAMPLTIETEYGKIKHIGTRYLVNAKADQVDVAVRSGKVKVSNDHAVEEVLNSQQKIQLMDSENSGISPIAANDPIWDWTFKAQAEFKLNQKSLHDFVEWYAHQTGIQVDWNQLESQTKRVKLNGSIKNMNAEQAIKTVFLSTQYFYHIKNGVLQITAQAN